MTAIELALLSPLRIRHVVQISSPIYTPEEQQAALHLYRARELQTDGSHLVDAWRNMQKFYNKDVPPAVLARNFTSSLRGGPMSHWGHQAAFTYPLAKKMPLVAQPVLVINPEDDLVAKTRRAPELLQHGRLHELPGQAHGFIDQMTEEFTQLLVDFLDEF
jgi:pimeloyl-ACP methyl ester carboxylesterase